jgi:ribosomal protein S18 acetylase RimI-like enzyme
MSVREVKAVELEALMLATQLLQRARRADPRAGLWEAADVQWWWRRPRQSDEVEKLFWVDDEGPAAGVLLTSWNHDAWQCDPVVVPGAPGPQPKLVWTRAIEHATRLLETRFEIPVSDDDRAFTELAQRSGLDPGRQDFTAWMDAADRPTVSALPPRFVLVDRTQRPDTPHPLRPRNGDGVAQRLDQCPLYDPTLDLAVETADGVVAGYSLYWYDPTTGVGLVEPVRVEEEFRRRGLARAMLTDGIDRLFRRGVQRIKISYETNAAGGLYQSVGFRQTSSATWYQSFRS